MARSRRGSFGLQPRVAPNVSNTIIALAREYVAKRDALIMDAWRNGGTFEGKKATDDMVLAYWKERGKDLDKGDPDYEQAKNQVMQLEYAIAQSKADVLHVQGKMSDSAYAQFFLKWAQKVPKNSEFYRTLQKDAAQLIESAKNKARVNGERARTEAFNTFVKTTTASQIAIGDAMTAALTDLSQKTGLSITGNGEELLSLLTQNIKANPAQYRRLLDSIHTADPNWNGVIDTNYFTTHLKQAQRGYDLIADRAQKGGFVSAYASATQGEASMSQWGQNTKVWPVAESYSNAENAFLRVWNDPNASQMDKEKAAGDFSARISQIANTPGIDVGSKTMLTADAQRLLGQDAGDDPSFGTAMLGRAGVDPKMTMQLGAWAQQKAEQDANPLAWAYAPVDANGQVDPSGKGPLGRVPAGAVQPGAQAVVIPGQNGQAVMAMMPTHAVYVTDPNRPNSPPTLAGYQLSYNVGGKMIQMWGYKDAKGNARWSLTSPIAEGSEVTTDNKGDVYVKPTPVDLSQSTNEKVVDRSVKGQVTTVSRAIKNGVITTTTTVETLDDKGHVASSQTQTQTAPVTQNVANGAFSPSRLAAGDIPGVTFVSPLQASVTAASSTQSADQVSKFASDPAFQQAFLSQTMQTLHTTNPFDARIASAWKQITTPADRGPDLRMNMAAAQRRDLRYPGEVPEAHQGSLNVTFGEGGTLKLPGVPSYLNGQNLNLGPSGLASPGMYDALATMLPGLGLAPTPPQTSTGSPAPTVSPTSGAVGPSPTTITPTTPAPGATAITPSTPAPSPVQQSNTDPTHPTYGGNQKY